MYFCAVPTRAEYLNWLEIFKKSLPAAATHTTCPIVWLEEGDFRNKCIGSAAFKLVDLIVFYGKTSGAGDGTESYFGGEDQILSWCREGSYFHEAPAVTSCATSNTCSGAAKFVDVHDFEYDLVVIGGKSEQPTPLHSSVTL